MSFKIEFSSEGGECLEFSAPEGSGDHIARYLQGGDGYKI